MVYNRLRHNSTAQISVAVILLICGYSVGSADPPTAKDLEAIYRHRESLIESMEYIYTVFSFPASEEEHERTGMTEEGKLERCVAKYEKEEMLWQSLDESNRVTREIGYDGKRTYSVEHPTDPAAEHARDRVAVQSGLSSELYNKTSPRWFFDGVANVSSVVDVLEGDDVTVSYDDSLLKVSGEALGGTFLVDLYLDPNLHYAVARVEVLRARNGKLVKRAKVMQYQEAVVGGETLHIPIQAVLEWYRNVKDSWGLQFTSEVKVVDLKVNVDHPRGAFKPRAGPAVSVWDADLGVGYRIGSIHSLVRSGLDSAHSETSPLNVVPGRQNGGDRAPSGDTSVSGDTLIRSLVSLAVWMAVSCVVFLVALAVRRKGGRG